LIRIRSTPSLRQGFLPLAQKVIFENLTAAKLAIAISSHFRRRTLSPFTFRIRLWRVILLLSETQVKNDRNTL
jgi:hypothetical protein